MNFGVRKMKTALPKALLAARKFVISIAQPMGKSKGKCNHLQPQARRVLERVDSYGVYWCGVWRGQYAGCVGRGVVGGALWGVGPAVCAALWGGRNRRTGSTGSHLFGDTFDQADHPDTLNFRALEPLGLVFGIDGLQLDPVVAVNHPFDKALIAVE